MELHQFTQNNPTLRHLLQQSQYFLTLDKRVKSLLPVNLHPHFQVACLQDGQLILLTTNSMAASRLKMMLPAILAQIQSLDETIMHIKIKVQPENPPVKQEKKYHIDNDSLSHFERTAEQLATQHPQLAQAIRNLIANQRQNG